MHSNISCATKINLELVHMDKSTCTICHEKLNSRPTYLNVFLCTYTHASHICMYMKVYIYIDTNIFKGSAYFLNKSITVSSFIALLLQIK